MSVGAEVLVVKCKSLERLVVAWQNAAEALLPVALVVICFHVPAVVGNTVERNLRCLGILHRVAHKARYKGGDVESVAVEGAHKHMVAYKVVHREVQPYITLALYALVNPLHCAFVYAGNNRVSCPHNLNALVHSRAESAQVALFFVCPAAVVLGGAHNEGCNVFFLLDEIVVDIVEELGLFVGFCALAPDVVEEHCERAHAKVVHLFELRNKGIAVLGCPFDVNARVNGPVEVHVVLLCNLHKLGNAVSLCLGVGNAPFVAVPGVVLGAIDIYVHLVLSIEIELAQTRLVAPGCAVEALHRSTEGNIGPIGNCYLLVCAVLHFAYERLYSIE